MVQSTVIAARSFPMDSTPETDLLPGLGVAGHAILAAACDYDAARFKGVAVRFTSPVFPGETLRTDLWREDGGVAFRSTVVERGQPVLGHGFATIV